MNFLYSHVDKNKQQFKVSGDKKDFIDFMLNSVFIFTNCYLLSNDAAGDSFSLSITLNAENKKHQEKIKGSLYLQGSKKELSEIFRLLITLGCSKNLILPWLKNINY